MAIKIDEASFEMLKDQDCVAVTDAFDRGVVHEPTEASVFAPLKRVTQASLASAGGISHLLLNHKQSTTTKKAENQTGVKLENQYVTLPDPVKALALGKLLRECIPCDARIIAAASLRIDQRLLDILKADVKARLAMLKNLRNLFNNVDIYGDYCHLLSFLNFMCVPDLQRMLAILLGLLTNIGLDFLKLNSLLMSLVLPFFGPLLMNLSALLDQFTQLVLSPLDCIINSINVQLRKLDVTSFFGNPAIGNARQKVNVTGNEVRNQILKLQGQTRSGLVELANNLTRGENLIRTKLSFYMAELAKLMKLDIRHTLNLVNVAGDKLVLVRLINLVRAMIKAKGQGFVCENSAKPSNAEMNVFFDTFLSPNSPYTFKMDDGDLVIGKKLTIGESGVVVKAQPLIDVTNLQSDTRRIKCSVKTSKDDAAKINSWMASLDKV